MAIFQRVGRVTNVMAHTSPTSSPDIRNIWQCKGNSTRVRQGCSWQKLCYSCFLGPARGYEKKSAKGVWTKPVPGYRKKPHLVPEKQRSWGGTSFLLLHFCPEHLIRNGNNFVSNSNCKANCLKAISVRGESEDFNRCMKMNFAHYYGGKK